MASLLTDEEVLILRQQAEIYLSNLVSEIVDREYFGFDAETKKDQAFWIYSNMKALESDILTDAQKYSFTSAIMKFTDANKFLIGYSFNPD